MNRVEQIGFGLEATIADLEAADEVALFEAPLGHLVLCKEAASWLREISTKRSGTMKIERVHIGGSPDRPDVRPDEGGRFLHIIGPHSARLTKVDIVLSEDDGHDLLKGLANALL